MADQIDAPEDTGKDEAGEVRRWLMKIDQRMEEMKPWRDEVRDILKLFRMDENRTSDQFNILFSNTETLMGALYQQPPTPTARRRYRSDDPVGRDVSEMLERALEYSTDTQDYDGMMKRGVFDFCTTAIGLLRVEYTPYFETRRDRIPLNDMDDPAAEGVKQDDEGLYIEGEPYEHVIDEDVSCRYWRWDRWCCDSAPLWKDKGWIAYEHAMTRDQMDQRFDPAKAASVALDWADGGEKEEWSEDKKSIFRRARVWEIWDKETRKRRWIATGLKDKYLGVDDDPLNLEGFFDCPRPMIWNSTNESDDPIPGYRQYRPLAIQLNMLETRKAKIAKELKWRGVTLKDANDEAMVKLATLGDGQFVAVQDMGALQQAGGLKNYYQAMDLAPLVQALAEIERQIASTKAEIFEITGLSDIVRGHSKASETATAQDLKARFGSQRIAPKQIEVERFARDLFRIMGEIIAEMFSPETLSAMTQMEVTPEMMEMLQSDRLRGFHVDIETRSTMADDEEADRTDRVEMLGALTKFITELAPLVQGQMIPLETAKAMIMFGLRGFKASREIEDAIDMIGQQPQQPPGMLPGPEMPMDPAMMPEQGAMPPDMGLQVIPGGLGG